MDLIDLFYGPYWFILCSLRHFFIDTSSCVKLVWLSRLAYFKESAHSPSAVWSSLYQLVYVCFFENVSVKISGFLCSYFLCSASAWILSSSAVWAFRFESHQLQFCSSLPLTLLVRYSYQPPVLSFPPLAISVSSPCVCFNSLCSVCVLSESCWEKWICIHILCVKMSVHDAMPFVPKSPIILLHHHMFCPTCGNIGVSLFLSFFITTCFFPLLPQFWPQECLALHWHDMISAPEIHGNSLCRWATWWRSLSSVPMDGGKVKSMARWEKPCLYTIIHLKLKYESSSREVLMLSCLFR